MKLIWYAIAWPVGLLWWLYFVIVRATSTVVVHGAEPNGAIYVNWHRHESFLVPFHGSRRRWMMMSPAPALAPIAVFARLVGLRLVRGASGARGREALPALEAALRGGESVSIAVDGPAGPAFVAKRGCVTLAQASGAAIVPIGYRCTRRTTVPGRWDRPLLPLPFGRIEIVHGDAIEATHDVEATLARVTQALDAIRRDDACQQTSRPA